MGLSSLTLAQGGTGEQTGEGGGAAGRREVMAVCQGGKAPVA